MLIQCVGGPCDGASAEIPFETADGETFSHAMQSNTACYRFSKDRGRLECLRRDDMPMIRKPKPDDKRLSLRR